MWPSLAGEESSNGLRTLPRLQKPEYLYFDGKIRPWEEATFHVSTEAVLRGLNVFEGLKGYWQPDGSFGLVAMPRHWARLRRSASLLHIPFEMSFEEFDDAAHALVKTLCRPSHDMWVRATLYVIDGHWGEGTVSDLVLTAYHQEKMAPAPIDLGVSTWRRASDLALPCRIKASTNYQVARLALMEGRPHGYDEMVLLNPDGRVAETTRTSLIIVRDGCVSTPPPWEGTLESITVDIIEALCADMGIPFERRPIELTELHIADEVALAGTISELTPVASVQGRRLEEPVVSRALLDRYRAAVTGTAPHPAVDLSCRTYAAEAAAATGA